MGFPIPLCRQTLAKAGHLKTHEEIVKHAEAFETTLHDQSKLNEMVNPSISRISDYCPQHQNSPTKPQGPCPGCGNTSHGAPGSKDRSSSIREKTASTATYPITLLEYAAKKKNPDIGNALIAHMHYSLSKDS